MILMIDNYDSFTYNLVEYLKELGEEVVVKRNDKITISEIKSLAPEMIVISPGPGKPEQAGVSMEIIDVFKRQIPLLGICLGHQAIAKAFQGQVKQAIRPTHAKVEAIEHYNQGVFSGLNNPLKVTRYHSLVVDKDSLANNLEVTAQTTEGEIMGLKHKDYLIEGVQFHPEAVLTEQGHQLLANFIAQSRGEVNDRKNSN